MERRVYHQSGGGVEGKETIPEEAASGKTTESDEKKKRTFNSCQGQEKMMRSQTYPSVRKEEKRKKKTGLQQTAIATDD